MIRILTDSASDILPAEAAQLGVDVIPLNVTLEDGTVIRDGVDLTPSEYYEHMAGCKKLPTTSQPSPELFEKFYAEAAAAGDEVVGIFLSHELSGTYQCAKLAADLANVDNVLFVDSTNVCLGEGLLVRMAAHLRDEGRSAIQIAATLEHAKEHLHLVAAIDDLKYLRKGGRLPAAVAVAGGMLGIKPLITIKEGKVAMAGKARGLPGAYVALFMLPTCFCINQDARTSLLWAKAGLGVAIVPKSAIALIEHENLKIYDIDHPRLTTSIHIICMKDRYLSETAQTFIDYYK